MAYRTTPTNPTLAIYTAKPPRIQESAGYGSYFDLRTEWERGYLYVTPTNAVTTYGAKNLPEPLSGAALIEGPDGLGILISRIFWDMTEAQTSGWTFTTSSNWENLDGYWGDTLHHHFESSADTASRAETTFNLPPDPIFELCFIRARADSQQTEPPITQIYFGEQWLIELPYDAGAQLYYYNAGRAEWVEMSLAEGSSQVRSFNTATKDDPYRLQVGCFAGYICLSNDDFHNCAWYPIPGGYWHTDGSWVADSNEQCVRWGHLSVENQGGEWGFSFHAPWMYQAADTTVAFPLESVGYAVDGNANAKQFYWWGRYKHDDLPPTYATFLLPRDGNGLYDYSIATVDTTSAQLTLKWKPSTWTSGTFTCYQTPEIIACGWAQKGEVNALTQDAATNVYPVAYEVRVPDKFSAPLLEVRYVDKAGTYRALAEGRRVTLTAGWNYNTGPTDAAVIFDGYIREFEREPLPGPAGKPDLITIRAVAHVQAFFDGKAFGTEPNFALFTVSDAMAWIGARCGFIAANLVTPAAWDTAYMTDLTPVEGTNTRGVSDVGRNPRWLPHFGARWGDFVEEILASRNESDWYYAFGTNAITFLDGAFFEDGDTAVADYTLKENWSKVAGDRPVYISPPPRTRRRSLSADDFATSIIGMGRAVGGTPILYGEADTDAYDYTNHPDKYMGPWPKNECSEYEWVSGAGQLQTLCHNRLNKIRRDPMETVVETDLIPALRRGHILLLQGPVNGKLWAEGIVDSGGKGKHFVVLQIVQCCQPKQRPRTRIIGRYIAEEV